MLVFKIRMVPQRIDNVPFKKRTTNHSLTREVWIKVRNYQKRCRQRPPSHNNRADLYAYKKPCKALAVSIALRGKNNEMQEENGKSRNEGTFVVMLLYSCDTMACFVGK